MSLAYDNYILNAKKEDNLFTVQKCSPGLFWLWQVALSLAKIADH